MARSWTREPWAVRDLHFLPRPGPGGGRQTSPSLGTGVGGLCVRSGALCGGSLLVPHAPRFHFLESLPLTRGLWISVCPALPLDPTPHSSSEPCLTLPSSVLSPLSLFPLSWTPSALHSPPRLVLRCRDTVQFPFGGTRLYSSVSLCLPRDPSPLVEGSVDRVPQRGSRSVPGLRRGESGPEIDFFSQLTDMDPICNS